MSADRRPRALHQVRADAGRHLVALGVEMARHRARRGEARRLQLGVLHQVERQHDVHLAFDRRAADFAVALRGMGVADARTARPSTSTGR